MVGQLSLCTSAAKFTAVGIPDSCKWFANCFASHPFPASMHPASAKSAVFHCFALFNYLLESLFFFFPSLLDCFPHSLSLVIFLRPRGRIGLAAVRGRLDAYSSCFVYSVGPGAMGIDGSAHALSLQPCPCKRLVESLSYDPSSFTLPYSHFLYSSIDLTM